MCVGHCPVQADALGEKVTNQEFGAYREKGYIAQPMAMPTSMNNKKDHAA